MVLIMKHYDNSGTLASFETELAMLKLFPSGLVEVLDLQAFLNPSKTFDQELDSLNSKYEADLDPLVKEHSMARARNTDNESSKVVAAQAKIAALDSWYESEGDALIIKYFS